MRRCSRIVALLAAVILQLMVAEVRTAHAQTLIVDAPPGQTLPTLTPSFTIRALGLPVTARPLRFTLFITRNSTGDSPFAETITTSSADSIVSVMVTRLLPSATTVYWKARVTLPDGSFFESPISSGRQVPRWLTLIEPNSPLGNSFDERQPRLVWQSARIDPAFGLWTYDLQILKDDVIELSTSGLLDTTFVPPSELQANALYRWQVQARVTTTGESIGEKSLSTFQILDPKVPTTTLLYQNFPNPFPSSMSFTTCFWFDVGAGGALISLDILDLRGTRVRSIVSSTKFVAGRYGVGGAGSGNNCDNRYVWNGTGADGRPVPAGVYLVRLNANGRVSFKRILFLGR